MRTARVFAHLLCLGAAGAALTACDPAEPTVDFAATTPAQREAALRSALDLRGDRAADLVTLAEVDHQAGASCPERRVDGDAVIYTASGCQGAASGVTWSGRLEARSSPRTSLLGGAPAPAVEELRFDDLHADRPDAPFAVDGVLRREREPRTGYVRIENALTITTTTSVTLDVEADCFLDQSTLACRARPGASGELGGHGRFQVIAAVRDTQGTPAAQVVLRGENDLAVDTAALDANDCLTYTGPSGARGALCLPAIARAQDPTQADGVSWVCDPSARTIQLTGFTRGTPIFAKVELRQDGAQKDAPLTVVRTEQDGETRLASAVLPLADVGRFECERILRDVGVRLVAVFADGSVDCDVTGDWYEYAGEGCY